GSLSGQDVVPLSHEQLDVGDARAFDATVGAHAPDIVIHAAALTDTTRCEREPQIAQAINATGAETAAKACAVSGAKLIAISTNEVFDGAKREPYREHDAPNPRNIYGLSKLLGERSAHDVLSGEETIIRTSWLYDDGANNYVAKVLAAARSGLPLRFATDEIASPTSAADLAEGITKL